MILWHSAGRKVVYLFRHLVSQGKFDETELGKENLGLQAHMATVDDVLPHRISLKSSGVLESKKAWLLCQYLCSTEILDWVHIIHKVPIWDNNGKLQRRWALINCSATTIVIALRLFKRLRISHEVSHITTMGLDGVVMQYAKDSCKMQIRVQCLDYLALVDELEVQVVPMQDYNLVLGLLWFHKRNPDIDWAHYCMTSLWSLSVSGLEKMTLMTMAVASKILEANNDIVNDHLLGDSMDIQMLGATTFNNHLVRVSVIPAFALRIEECPRLLGATLGSITLDSPGNTDPSAEHDKQGAGAVVRAGEPLQGHVWTTATG